MNKKIYPISIQLKENNAKVIQGINQYESGLIFSFQLNDGTKAFDFSTANEISLVITPPNTAPKFYSANDLTDYVEAENGQLRLSLPESTTELMGMHVCALYFWADGIMIGTGRFNYYVGSGLYGNEYDQIIHDHDNYPVINSILAQLSSISAAETGRVYAENLRAEAEKARADETAGLVAQATQTMMDVNGKFTAINTMYDEILNGIGNVTGVDLAGVALTSQTNPRFASIETELARLRQKTDERCFVASNTAPTDTSKLWIDTGNGNLIKYYSGSEWVSCNIVTFA